MKKAFAFPVLGCLLAVFGACGPELPEEVASVYDQVPERIDFNFHVRPILSDRCFACHGPDEQAREAELRLDLKETAFAKLKEGEGKAFVPGNTGKSVAIQRILSHDPDMTMPPPESNLSLTEKEKAILTKWVDQGAKWKSHWAFSPPKKTVPPELQQQDWPRHNPIDAFIQQKLAQQGLTPAPEAGKERLLRRLSMDLRGLPPSLEEMEAFLADERPDAYEQVVDRFLASDAAAERLAMEWMDIARYADSHGLHADGWRLMWPWRDWVIEAFKQNMTYDEFVSWQLAGDLMPHASKDQKLATAFHRNHPMTAEGGAIDEEFRLNYVFDRTETTSTAFLGLTLNCARCHDHKFDPFSQKEYYQLTAFFNNVRELGMTGDDGNFGPHLVMSDEETDVRIQHLEDSIRRQSERLKLTQQEIADTYQFVQKISNRPRLSGEAAYYPLERIRKGGKGQYIVDGNPLSTSSGKPEVIEGIRGNGLKFTGVYDELNLKEVGLIELYDPLSVGLWFNTRKRKAEKTQTLIGNSGHKNNFWRGWDFYLDTLNRPSARLIHSLPHNLIHVRAIDSVQLHRWTHVAFSYDGSGDAAGLKLYIDGQAVETEILYNRLYKSIYPVGGGAHLPEKRPLRVGKSYRGFTGDDGVFKGMMDEIYLFNRPISPLEVAMLAGKAEQEHPEQLQAQQEELLRTHHVYRHPKVKREQEKLRELRRKWMEVLAPLPEVMVMEEMATPRTTYAYNRGEYDAPMYEVQAATPEQVFPFPEELPQNRLGLAQWLFHPDNPLTARVTVNRYWQMIFGKGLVSTPQDFGVQGALPSHPALLDWLAVELMENGWDVKHLLRQMVMSATYRQSSAVRPELQEKDPTNLLLARGATYRLPAEMIRDNALAASGLLVQKVGGESVRPYQPEGLWIEKGNFSHVLLRYKVTKGDSLYRRSLYTFVKRTSPHPAMTAFDAPNRDVCTVQRENTNTPLQALILLNDPQFVEAARVLGERMQTEGGESLSERIQFAFRLSTGRQPKAEEIQLLKELYHKQLSRFEADPKGAREFISVGEYPVNEDLNPVQTAAYTMLASTMLNHDEAYMKR